MKLLFESEIFKVYGIEPRDDFGIVRIQIELSIGKCNRKWKVKWSSRLQRLCFGDAFYRISEYVEPKLFYSLLAKNYPNSGYLFHDKEVRDMLWGPGKKEPE